MLVSASINFISRFKKYPKSAGPQQLLQGDTGFIDVGFSVVLLYGICQTRGPDQDIEVAKDGSSCSMTREGFPDMTEKGG